MVNKMYQIRYKDKDINVLIGKEKTKKEAETRLNLEYINILEIEELEGEFYIIKEKCN